MQFLISSTLKDLKRRLKDPVALGVWFGIPLMIGGLISLATGGSDGATPKAHVLLVDQDDSFVSNLLASSEGPEGLGELRTWLEEFWVDRLDALKREVEQEQWRERKARR